MALRYAPTMIVAVLALVIPQLSVSADSICAQGITPVQSPKAVAYRERGDRCEGLYVQRVLGTGLKIVGFHRAPPRFTGRDRFAYVSTDAQHAADEKRLTLVSTRRRQYYRLDTVFTGSNFRYPLNLSRHPELHLVAEELAARSCIDRCAGREPVLVPVAIASADTETLVPYIVVQSTEDVTSLEVVIHDADAENATDEPLLRKQIIGDGGIVYAWEVTELGLQDIVAQAQRVRLTILSVGRDERAMDSVSAELLLR